jgi:hypothetical protein
MGACSSKKSTQQVHVGAASRYHTGDESTNALNEGAASEANGDSGLTDLSGLAATPIDRGGIVPKAKTENGASLKGGNGDPSARDLLSKYGKEPAKKTKYITTTDSLAVGLKEQERTIAAASSVSSKEDGEAVPADGSPNFSA